MGDLLFAMAHLHDGSASNPKAALREHDSSRGASRAMESRITASRNDDGRDVA